MVRSVHTQNLPAWDILFSRRDDKAQQRNALGRTLDRSLITDSGATSVLPGFVCAHTNS
jgi:hypothetical protein